MEEQVKFDYDYVPTGEECDAKKVVMINECVAALFVKGPGDGPTVVHIKWDGCCNHDGLYTNNALLHTCDTCDLIRYAADILEVQIDKFGDNGYGTDKRALRQAIDRLEVLHDQMTDDGL